MAEEMKPGEITIKDGSGAIYTVIATAGQINDLFEWFENHDMCWTEN